jgi:hypothetical protein
MGRHRLPVIQMGEEWANPLTGMLMLAGVLQEAEETSSVYWGQHVWYHEKCTFHDGILRIPLLSAWVLAPTKAQATSYDSLASRRGYRGIFSFRLLPTTVL